MLWNALYLLDLLAIVHFARSYYCNCYRKGYRIDLWHTQLFLICVLPTMVMFPFSRNELNALILGSDYASVVAVIPQVFLISLLGYCAILVGGSLWKLHVGLGVRRAAAHVLDILPDCSFMMMSSRSVLVFHTTLCVLLQSVVLLIYFAGNGFGFDLRAYTFAHPELRPVTQLVSFYSVLTASHALARYVDKKERVLLTCTLVLTFGLVFFGSRSSLLGIYLSIMLCYLLRLRGRADLFKIVAVGSLLVMVILYLGQARAGEYSISTFISVIIGLLLFGDNLSDLRDFGWVYVKWDHVFWGGKTYLAAITAFVPRFASEFRDTWGLGAATAATVGFDPHVHPGLRPGAFGEGFLNFGILGVIAVGILAGFVLRRMDTEAKRAFTGSQPSMRKAFASTMLMNVVGCILLSVSVSQMYVIGAVFAFTWFCLGVQRLFTARQMVSSL